MPSQWYRQRATVPCEQYRQQAQQQSDNLTKPPGSLGVLERVAIELCAMQQTAVPAVEAVGISIFAADHGVVAEGVSAFPQVVTAEMVRNFSRGGAAITVLAGELGARFEVVNVGTVEPMEPLSNVVDHRIAPGTANFCQQPAMSQEQLSQALQAGREAVARSNGAQCFIGGEMGIGNTTAASALSCALLGIPAVELAGRGTGLDDSGVAHKAAVIERALALHAGWESAEQALQVFGGLEIAALAGAYIACAQQQTPVLVDGFICTAAALAAVRINPSIRPWLLFSHCSDEAGHRRVLAAMQAEPLLALGLRLGEGSGAAVALPLLRMACALHNQMASFDSAGVTKG